MDFNHLDISALLETADCASYRPIELHNQDSISNGLNRLSTEVANVVKTSLNTALDAKEWLPFAAEKYEISSDMSDYVLVPVIIMPSDLPNRNMVAFPFSELSSWNPSSRSLTYASWRGAPTHIEHINRDYTKAKGVVFDTSMQPMHGRSGGLWKVLALCGFCRHKDAALANDILTGHRPNYSMGALVNTYSCSVCGAQSEIGAGKVLPCGLEHVHYKSGRFKTFNVKGEKVLGHFNAHGIQGFEVSSVSVPAWPSAVTDIDQHIRY